MASDPIAWFVLALSIALIAMSVAVEIAFPVAGRGELRGSAERGDKRAAVVQKLLGNAAQLLATTMLMKTVGLVLAGAAIVRLVDDVSDPVLVAVIVTGVALMAAGVQVVVRSFVLHRADVVALQLAPVMQICQWLLWPIASLLRSGAARIATGNDGESAETIFMTEEGLRLLINVAEEEDAILDSEREMIASILEMDDTVVREVMVPRIDIVAINVETSLRDALDTIIQAGHSRIPVYEGNVDRVVGFLYAKDLLKCFRDSRMDMPIYDLLRPAYFVPVSKKVNMLFREMQKRRVHVAVVVDEYGGTAGLVTIEDLIEEIVGEIQDEYDIQEDSYVQPMGPHAYLLNSRLDIYTLSDLLSLELEDEDTDTLGGLIYSRMGRVPEQGASVEVRSWRFTVLSLDGRRIDQVRAELATPGPDAGPDQVSFQSGSQVAHDSNSVLNLPALD